MRHAVGDCERHVTLLREDTLLLTTQDGGL